MRLLLIFLIPFLLQAQLYLDVDWSTFRGNDSNVLVEIYSLFPRSCFQFEKGKDGRYYASGAIKYGLAQNDTMIVYDTFLHQDVVNDTLKIPPTQKIPDIEYFLVPEGEYELIIQMIDRLTGKSIKTSRKVYLKGYNTAGLQISDLTLASMVTRTEKENKFSKYGYDVVPNASLVFSTQKPIVYTFAEIYNLKYDQSNPGAFTVQYEITDLDGNRLRVFPSRVKRKAGDSAVEINQLTIAGLESGVYLLRLIVVDEDSSRVTRSKKFFVYNQAQAGTPGRLVYDDYSNYNEEQLQEIYNKIQVLMSNKERRRYKKSDLEGKRNVIREFWKMRDPTPETPQVNEFRENFEKRLAYVQKNFNNRYARSGLSDRARVYLLYGPPDEIEKHPNDVGTKPWEEWFYYDIEGGVVFIFADLQGFGLYELIHSTARNEIQDYNWYRRIQALDTGTMDNIR